MPHAARGEVDVAGSSTTARVVVLLADAEVELAAHDDAELLVVLVVVQERAGRAALDAPEAQLQVVAGDDPPAEPRSVGLVERVVVEEVAGVLQVSIVVPVGIALDSLQHALLDVGEVGSEPRTTRPGRPRRCAWRSPGAGADGATRWSTTSAGWPRRRAARRTRRSRTARRAALPYTSVSSGLPQALAISVWNWRSRPGTRRGQAGPERGELGGSRPAPRRSPARSPARRWRLDHRSRTSPNSLRTGGEVAAGVEAHARAAARRRTDPVAPPLEVPPVIQTLDRLAHRGAGHAELLAQHALGRQRAPGASSPERIASARRAHGSPPARCGARPARTSRRSPCRRSGVAPLAGEVERLDDRLVLLVAPRAPRGRATSPRTRGRRGRGRRGSCWRRDRWRRPGRRPRRGGRASPRARRARHLPGEVVHPDRSSPGLAVGPARSPIVKKAMSWWLDEAGPRMNTKRPSGSSMIVEKPSTSA